MPELPEVHTIVLDLDKHIKGTKILKTIVAKKYRALPNSATFIKKTENTNIKSVKRIAKNILIELDNKHLIRIHLAMTGQVLLRDPKNKSDKHVKVVMVLDSGKQLRFCDMRMFGKAELLKNEDLVALNNKYGPEILDKSLRPEDFLSIIHSKRTNIKNLLLDQSKVSGLGNIYATDALFLAGIDPQTKTKELTLSQAKKLLQAARDVLNEGIKNRGSTLADKMYVDIFGKSGSHQNHFKIYGKSKCPKCTGKTKFIKINGRGTYYCPICQPES